MGGTVINGEEEEAALLKDLLKATKENIETTTEQNKKMGFLYQMDFDNDRYYNSMYFITSVSRLQNLFNFRLKSG